jgi:hypothetical protein
MKNRASISVSKNTHFDIEGLLELLHTNKKLHFLNFDLNEKPLAMQRVLRLVLNVLLS